MTFLETISLIKKFLGSSEGLQTLGERIKMFNEVTQMIEAQADEMNQTEKEVIANTEQINKVRESITMIKRILMEIPITEGVKDFVISFGQLVMNWVNNCAKTASDILVDVDFIIRFVQYHFSSVEILKILPSLIQKINSLNRISLPSIELARHYLKTLDDVNQGG